MADWNEETAEWYAEKYGEYPTNRLGVDRLDVRPEMTVVDVGCGTGAALRHASAQVTKGRLIGVDPVERMVEIARERTADHPANERIEYRTGPARALPVDDDSVDLVLAFDSFDHWEDQAAGLSEVRRILRPGGRLAVVKDGGAPGGRASETAFEKLSNDAGFVIETAQEVRVDGVAFAMWVCRAG